ncbi:MAG: lasso peptide biosynthesis B2 protein [Lentisphaerae bacterium]|nr:lasso peptide biosynthesis B2 protein [Lentisphaerota bacterium]
MNLIRKFLKLSISNKRVLLEAVCFLFLAKILIVLLPYRFLKKFFGNYKLKCTESNFKRFEVENISYLIQKVSNKLPIKFNCLNKAIAAKSMLKIRRINSTLYVGLSKNNKNKLIAHAWLMVNDIPVTGGKNNDEFSEVAHWG